MIKKDCIHFYKLSFTDFILLILGPNTPKKWVKPSSHFLYVFWDINPTYFTYSSHGFDLEVKTSKIFMSHIIQFWRYLLHSGPHNINMSTNRYLREYFIHQGQYWEIKWQVLALIHILSSFQWNPFLLVFHSSFGGLLMRNLGPFNQGGFRGIWMVWSKL